MKQKINDICLRALTVLCLMMASTGAWAQTNVAENDTVDNDFVIVSLVVADPGEAMISVAGHVAIRMQCPLHDMDYVFTYETVGDYSQIVMRYLAGMLKSGDVAYQTDDFMEIYRTEGRGVREYEISLPLDVKRKLWKILDERIVLGQNYRYEPLTQGCAQNTLLLLKECIAPATFTFTEEARKSKYTIRDLIEKRVHDNTWTGSILNLFFNGVVDKILNNEENIVMPEDLIELLQGAEFEGQKVLQTAPKQLLPSHFKRSNTWFSPILFATLLLLLTLLALGRRNNAMDYALLVIQTLLGIVNVWLVFISENSCTEWTWLIIPFNPLPLLFWKWRAKWALPYAIVIGIWIAAIALWPHYLMGRAFLILSAAYIISYLNIHYRTKNRSNI